MSLLLLSTVIFLPPIRFFLDNYVLPKPGEGPSEADMVFVVVVLFLLLLL